MASRRSNSNVKGRAGDRARPVVLWLQWGTVCLIGLTTATLLAAQAPGRARLLGLFAIAFGGLCGWGMGLAARKIGVGRSLITVLSAGLLIATAEVGLTLESWRQHRRELREVYDPEASPEAVGGGQLFVPEALLEEARKERRRKLEEKSRFSAYLEHRLQRTEWTDHPWPLSLWIAELTIGTGLGAWLFLHSAKAVEPS